MNKKIEEIKSFIEEELTDREKVELHNRYCAETNNLDSYIYNMGEFDEIMSSETPSDIALKIYNGEFCPNDDYFTFNGYNNLKSGYGDELVYAYDIARHICENEDFLDNDEIEEFCNSDEEE